MSTKKNTLDFSNIQGDIILGLPKKKQLFYFFQIRKDVINDRCKIQQHKESGNPGFMHLSGTNIAFSSAGLKRLGINEPIDFEQDTPQRDPDPGIPGPFTHGQFANAERLGDPGRFQSTRTNPLHYEPAWCSEYKQPIHGVFLITGDCWECVDERSKHTRDAFLVNDVEHAVIVDVLKLRGQVRPEAFKGHEHFGFEDGISNPEVEGIEEYQRLPKSPMPPIDPGIMLVRRPGDLQYNLRPHWTKDGSFLVFRQLDQLVPEFDDFLDRNADKIKDETLPHPIGHDHKKELLGARLMGRWKSGTPIPLFPFKDSPNPADWKRNDFDFGPSYDSQYHCPFGAHIRKMVPRGDLANQGPNNQNDWTAVNSSRIMRQGIPYGPELTDEEKDGRKTLYTRGLAFVCYQSNISSGFQFLQHSWANNIAFPPKGDHVTGYDPIIGQNKNDPTSLNPGAEERAIVGTFPERPQGRLILPQDFVVPQGGEYFFSPSLHALRSSRFSLPGLPIPAEEPPQEGEPSTPSTPFVAHSPASAMA